ncbi:winged helix-turn-helix domain-containing protein [Mesorhizobium yinganensis]|uniref:winged helix-turn-helix domain-containing protein n=1 Tax=Mesorhizobium yinganensis TaxID=3157707 RepID=UPI0032B737AE
MDSPEPDNKTYIFGPFRLLPRRQLLLREGLPVRIGGRALDILTLLARRSGQVVGKTELLGFCWPSTFVHESNLKVNIAALRRVLSDGSAEPYIATVAGRGYRFTASVEVEQVEVSTPARIVSTQAKPLLKRPKVIGRSDDIERLVQKLAAARCVTIVGPGGVGKTTIALAVAHQVLAKYPHGACFVDLSTVGDPQYATAAIAAGVGARQRSEDTLSEIIELLHDRRMLLILDNCEHLSSTMTAVVNRLLESLPTVTLLATSREPLRTVSEHVYRLPSLDVPPADRGLSAKNAIEFGAVHLFVTRAQERGQYVLSDADAPLVSAICRRLDGIPLAIELVATKTFTFGVPTLLTMLEQKFLLLSNGERMAPLRQQTLLATLDWSYRLLSEDEAVLLRLLSVFAGAFRLQDAIAMSEAVAFDATQTIDALERLTSKSLVYADYQDGSIRYRLLESTRAYAAERLGDAGERDSGLQRHAWHTLALFERASEELETREKRDWMADYADRVDDLRNAMSWSFGKTSQRMLGVRLTAAAIPLWYELSSLSEMQSRVERALLAARELGDCPTDLTMKLIAARASGMSFAQHLALGTETAWNECHALGVEANNVKYQLFGLWGLAAHLIYVGRPLEGIDRLHQFIALAETQADWSAVDEGQRMMALAEMYVGKISSARQRLEMLATRYHRPSEPVRFARFQAERGVAIRCSLALVLWVSGEPGRAMQVAREAVERADASGHVVSQSNALAVFAIPITLWSGDYESCARFLAMLEENGRREDIGIWREFSRFFKSALSAKLRGPGAAAEMKARLGDLIAARNLLRAPMHYSMVAEALLDAGALADARAVIDEAHALAIKQVAHWCLPEILRIAGLVELHSGDAGRAERLLRRSIKEASAIGALTLELRAALSLSAKLEGDGCINRALGILEASCGKFRQEDVFAELREARARLHVLRAAAGNALSYA